MKPDQMAMVASVGTPTECGAIATVASNDQTAYDEDARGQPASSETSFVGPLATARLHTLNLTGGLDRGSAHVLEAAIDRLCDEGVSSITLDLRGLSYIDPVGVAVIAFRCGLCQRRGCEVALIRGPRPIHRAFERAGVASLLPFLEDDSRTAEEAVPKRAWRRLRVAPEPGPEPAVEAIGAGDERWLA